MGIADFDFVKYDQKLLEHLKRHLEGSGIPGSYFLKGVFPTAQSVVDYALDQIADNYHGKLLIQQVDAGCVIGYDNLVPLDALPKEAEVLQEPRDGRMVYVVGGIEQRPTTVVTIIAKPQEDGRHGFETIYPGTYAPLFPMTEEELQSEYSRDALSQAFAENEVSTKFWKTHGFVQR
ncbi:MAG: hypothetical protein HY832_01205 [Candidatus Aenigmarchaeota archaeon]|nr:hypothetical protein [Candidatus Aenigmarchaeota archaeon]